MAREPIKDWTGKIIGFTEQSGNKKWLSDFYGRRVGYYDCSTNKTHEFSGRMVGQGDITMTLLK